MVADRHRKFVDLLPSFCSIEGGGTRLERAGLKDQEASPDVDGRRFCRSHESEADSRSPHVGPYPEPLDLNRLSRHRSDPNATDEVRITTANEERTVGSLECRGLKSDRVGLWPVEPIEFVSSGGDHRLSSRGGEGNRLDRKVEGRHIPIVGGVHRGWIEVSGGPR